MDNRESLIHTIYEGVTDKSAWRKLLGTLAEELSAAGVGLGVQDMRTHEFWAVAEAGIDPGLHDTYARLAPQNRIWQEIGRTGRPLTDQMVMPKSALLRSALYADWFAPQGFHGVIAAPVMAQSSISGVVVAFSSKIRGDFEQIDLDFLAELAPHLGRAVALHLEREQLLTELHADRELFEKADDPILLLDAKLSVLYANKAGRELLDRREGLRVRDHRLVANNRDDDVRLQSLLRPGVSATIGYFEEFAIVNRSERRPLLLKITPVAPPERRKFLPNAAWLVRIVDPERQRVPDAAMLQRVFGLTAAEARIVCAMLPPRSESEMADELRLSKNTFRWHLHHAYEKLGVNGRDELVYLLTGYGLR